MSPHKGKVRNEKTMRAARIHKIHEPLRIEQIPIPKIGPQDVLLKVKACGICHSDLHMMDGVTPLPRYPMTPGHEFAGVIQDVGLEVQDWKPGQRVCVYFLITCGNCPFCLTGRESLCLNRIGIGAHTDGAYAEFVKVPARCLVELPEEIPFDQGAILTDAVATPFHAIVKRSQMKLGQTVIIFGVGGLGVHAVQIAKINGAGKVIAVDVLDSAIQRAKLLGADLTIDGQRCNPVEAIQGATGGLGGDVALEFVGTPKVIEQAMASVRRGGRVVVVGIGDQEAKLLPAAIFARNEIEIVGSYGFEKMEIKKIVEMVSQGVLDLSRSVSHRITLDQANEGLRQLEAKRGDPVRIVIVFP